MDLTIVIGGEAGQGLKTIDNLLSKILFRMGYHIYSTKNYMSRIRGGHNYITIRFGLEPVSTITDNIDILLALNEETVSIHKDKVNENGIIIFDGELEEKEDSIIKLAAAEIAKQVNKKGINTVFIGAVLKILGLNIDKAVELIEEYFKSNQVTEDNILLLKKGFAEVDNIYKLPEGNDFENQIYLDGNNAIAVGAAAAGVKFYAAYPMSPATSIMNYLADKQEELNLVVEQAEDEIAAINMALGGSYSGMRSMTGTSGGGLALMNETIGLSGITETPLVIVDVQRPGPATGLPTRTEQGDLLFAINSAQGDFPLMVMAPRDHRDLFYQTFRAFNLADKYQIPVIILSDQYLANSGKNVETFDFNDMKIEKYLVSSSDQIEHPYRRYKLTEDGISPRAYPGQFAEEVVVVDSDEHDEYGHIVEAAEARNLMVEKRARKLEELKEEDLKEPIYKGREDIDYLVIGWGSTYGSILEAYQMLKNNGCKIGMLSFNDLWPLPQKELLKRIDNDVQLIVVENNATGQFASLISRETGINVDFNILKYSGRPFSGQEVYERIKEEVIE